MRRLVDGREKDEVAGDGGDLDLGGAGTVGGPGREHVTVRGAAWPAIADAAHDGGALKRLEVAVSEVKGGVALDDGDLRVAEEAG